MVNCRIDKNVKQKVPQVHLVGAIDPLEKKHASSNYGCQQKHKNVSTFHYKIATGYSGTKKALHDNRCSSSMPLQ
jgi:hypothetical protein